MEFVHLIDIAHIAGFGIGGALVAAGLKGMVRGKAARVRSDYAPQRRRPIRSLFRLVVYVLRGTIQRMVNLGLALVSPIGILLANQRYPLVAPVLAPFEERVAALGHRTGHARYFPLLAWSFWLVRCVGCHHRSLFREVQSPDGTSVELKVLGTSPWRTHRCTAEYLTVQPTPVERPVRRTRPRTRLVSAGQARKGQPTVTDKTA